MIIHSKNFNIKQIAQSGQCFRMNPIDNDSYSLIAYGRYLILTQIDEETIELSCSEEEYSDVWEDYFDMRYDYDCIVQKLQAGTDDFLRKASEYGRGIRILRQESFEAAISFIISQNKNIPAIKSCIEAICEQYGERRVSSWSSEVTYYTFPTPQALATASREDLRKLKTGYRDEYIIKASQAFLSCEVDLENLKTSDCDCTIKALKSIHGIGDKVANCIALYGLHHIEVFPVDVWIKRILKEIYNDEFDQSKYEGYAGIVQQYMFYYMRHLQGI